MVRERHYEDAELAKRLNEWLVNHFSGIDIHNSQQGSRIYFAYPPGEGVEYIAEFHTEGGIRGFSFYVENPENSLVKKLQENLADDGAFRTHQVLSRYKHNLKIYKGVFRREEIGQKLLKIETKDEYGKGTGEKTISTAYVRNTIKRIPLGKERHLSENFLKWAYDYCVRAVMLFVSEHK